MLNAPSSSDIEKDARKTVLDYYERAILGEHCSVNYWYQPNVDASKLLRQEGLIQDAKIGNVVVGTIYKGHIFKHMEGPGDCNTLLVNMGKI